MAMSISEIEGRLRAVRLEQAKQKLVRKDRPEHWYDLISTAIIDKTHKPEFFNDTQRIGIVIPFLHRNEVQRGILRDLWLADLIRTSDKENDHRVFLDHKGVKIWQKLHPLMPESSSIDRMRFRCRLMLTKFYKLSNQAIVQLLGSKLIPNAKNHDEAVCWTLILEYHGGPSTGPRKELINAGLVVFSDVSNAYHLTDIGLSYVKALNRANFNVIDFIPASKANVLSLFKGGLIPSVNRNETNLTNPTDIDIKRDGLFLTGCKIFWCWKHRNDPITLENWIAPTLDSSITKAHEELIALDSKIYEAPELSPIMTWTVEDQRKQNDAYWNSRGPTGREGIGAPWLNPAMYDVGPFEPLNCSAEPTDPPEWWTPWQPKAPKQDAYNRSILMQAMEPPSPAPKSEATDIDTTITNIVVHTNTNNNNHSIIKPHETKVCEYDFQNIVHTMYGSIKFQTPKQVSRFRNAYNRMVAAGHYTDWGRDDIMKLADDCRVEPESEANRNNRHSTTKISPVKQYLLAEVQKAKQDAYYRKVLMAEEQKAKQIAALMRHRGNGWK